MESLWVSDESHWVLWDREMTKLGLELRSMLEEIYHSIFSCLFASTLVDLYCGIMA